jgi:xanthine dehydrogenase FAD-binding subunit
MLKNFQYLKPKTELELIQILKDAGADGKILAGGTDLLIYMKQGTIRPKYLIDIKGISEYSKIKIESDGTLHIGASVTCNDVIEHDYIKHHFPVLVEAAKTLGSYQLRNRATVVGNVCNASPAADMAGPLLVLGSSVFIDNDSGGREIPIKIFFTGVKKSVLNTGEYVKSIKVPAYFKDAKAGYMKASRIRGHDLGICNVALSRVNGTIKVAVGSCNVTPVLLPDFESSLAQSSSIIDSALKNIKPIDDIRGSKEYRAHLVKIFIKRLFEKGNNN